MPSKEKKETTEENVVRNVHVEKPKKKKVESDDDEKDKDYEPDESESDSDDSDESDDETEDNDVDPEGLTDVGLYNVLGNFLLDEDGNSIAVSLSNIAKELAKLNHTLKKFSNK